MPFIDALQQSRLPQCKRLIYYQLLVQEGKFDVDFGRILGGQNGEEAKDMDSGSALQLLYLYASISSNSLMHDGSCNPMR